MTPAEDLARIERALGAVPRDVRPAPGHGAPSNRRWLVKTDAGRAFVKIAAFDYTADWLRLERTSYLTLGHLSCMPRFLGWDDDGVSPALAIEDLSAAAWPPPWTTASVQAVIDAIREIGATPPPAGLRAARASEMFDLNEGWRPIEDDPDSFVALGVCTQGWLEAHLDALREAADAVVVDGDTLAHADVRSDNLCLREDRAILVDWNWVCVGAEDLDMAGWLPSLWVEGGPAPWELLPGRGPIASLLAGFFLEHARRESIPQAPHVRQLQLDQGRAALRWSARELGLPPPG